MHTSLQHQSQWNIQHTFPTVSPFPGSVPLHPAVSNGSPPNFWVRVRTRATYLLVQTSALLHKRHIIPNSTREHCAHLRAAFITEMILVQHQCEKTCKVYSTAAVLKSALSPVCDCKALAFLNHVQYNVQMCFISKPQVPVMPQIQHENVLIHTSKPALVCIPLFRCPKMKHAHHFNYLN